MSDHGEQGRPETLGEALQAAAESRRWAIVNARLVDGDPNGYAGIGGVLIEDDRIVDAGPDVSREALGGVASVDLGGRSIVPGLIDAHVHLCWDASATPVQTLMAEVRQPADLSRRAAANALATLAQGTTTVRDLGGPNNVVFGLREAIAVGATPGPRIVASGAVVTTPGGHCHYIGRLAQGAHAASEVAKDQVRVGADIVKVMASGGVHTPGSDPDRQQYGLYGLQAIALAVHQVGRRVTAHATSRSAIRSAVAAGIDSIQHGGPVDEWTVAQMARWGVALTPTLGTGEAILRHIDDHRIPDHVRARAMTRNRSGVRVDGFRRAVRAGVAIVAGTDAGTTFVAHGSLPTELSLMREAGLSPRATIAAATSSAARELGLAGLIGVLARGAQADLVVVEADPLADPAALEHPVAVVQRGRVVADISGALGSLRGGQ